MDHRPVAGAPGRGCDALRDDLGQLLQRVNPGSPFAGTGKSGYGREMGFAAMAEYTTRKSVWINVDAALPDWYAE